MMPLPKTRSQNILAWVGSIILALLVSFFSALAQQLAGSEPINWRPIWLDVINTALSLTPVVAIGLGLPALGREKLVAQAQAQANDIDTTIDYGRLADLILERYKHDVQHAIGHETSESR